MQDTRRFQFVFDNSQSNKYVVLAQIMSGKDCMHLYLTSPAESDSNINMNNLTVAMQTPYDPMPATTNVLESESIMNDTWCNNISSKLAKRLKKQILISCHLPSSYEAIIGQLELELLKTLINCESENEIRD